MSTPQVVEDLRTRVLAHYPLLFLSTWEEERWESELATLALDLRQGLVTWSATEGFKPPLTEAEGIVGDPMKVLEQVGNYPTDHLILLKDFHPYLSSPDVVRKLRDLTGLLPSQNKMLLILGPEVQVPLELERDALKIDLPLPDVDDLHQVLDDVWRRHEKATGRKLEGTDADKERLVKAVIGMTQREADRAFGRAFLDRDKLDDDLFMDLVNEKKSLLKGSELLEFYTLQEGVQDIGGLEGLKDWLASRASAYSERARKAGLPMPRGALLLGIQGCGKSLTARAAARLLSFPLVRLDIAGLLSSDRGSSEKNMREALQTIETVAPAVLWLDEVEKAFAGVGESGQQDGTMTRLFGTFLTWLQDHTKPIFVIATSNSIANLPPEMLRKGRFDELFFINLPNYHERIQILAIHLQKRKLTPQKFDLEELSRHTDGYSGAELEQVIISAMFQAYSEGRKLAQSDLSNAREETVPLSVTMEEKIFELREWARTRCRAATPDSRVMQMLEEESRLEE